MADAVVSSSPLPPLYSAWITELIGAEVPNETRATCNDCAMCNNVAEGARSFNADTKCCTYMPVLASFLVGRVLADEDPAAEFGRSTVRARLADGQTVTPLGLGVPPSFGLLYQGGKQFFGQSRGMRCPHYIDEGGLCGVWRHRNAICATWFCKHVRGEPGQRFWEAVRGLLSAVETELSCWCMVELGVDAAAIDCTLLAGVRPGGMGSVPGRGDRAFAKLWGSWAGREEEFYRACANLVDPLDFAGVLRVTGPEVELRARVVRAAWDRLQVPDAPARLRMSELTVLRTTKSKVRVNAYSAFDPVEMPRRLFDALPHFDGRPNEEALAAIVAEGGPRLSKALVRKLADFTVLAPADESDGGEPATSG